MLDINKIIRISAGDLGIESVTIVNLDEKTNTIGIIRELKDILIFPIKSKNDEVD